MKRPKSLPNYSVAELFCGCGGFSHGFCRTGRFHTVLGNDVKNFALKTFKANHKYGDVEPAIIEKDIRTVSDSEIVELLKTKGVENLDCLLGGPPCQGFSQMRRTKARGNSKIARFGGYNKLDQDPRNDLVLRFLEIAAVLNPKVIVIENVPQFLHHYHDGKAGGIAQQVEEILRDLEYDVTCDVVNAADFGVPQLRQRAVIIASRLGKISLPAATHGDPDLKLGKNIQPWITVKEALADLPLDPEHHDVFGGLADAYTEPAQTTFQKQMRSSESFPYGHISRTYQKRILDIIAHMRPGETWDDASARMQTKYAKLISRAMAKGESENKARQRLITEGKILPVFFKRYYWSAYTRLAWDHPALTITANANFLGSGRFTHPDRQRGITIREAARLQSFDDAFTFITSDESEKSRESTSVGLDMIGEAVPPLLAKAIAEVVVEHLDEREV